MKAARLTLIVTGAIALTMGASHAAWPAIAAQQAQAASGAKPNADSTPDKAKSVATAEKALREQRHVRVQAKGLASLKSRPANRENQLSVKRRPGAGNAAMRQRGPAQLAGGQTVAGATNTIPAARSFNPNRPLVQHIATIAHHGANPPAVGGIANTSRARAAVVDGTGLRRKP